MEQPTGKLALIFRKKASGKTYLAKQYFKLPLQIMAPHYQDEDGTAFVYLLNPSGGILQHDRLFTKITLEEDSRALVTTPSSTKFYKMDDGYARLENEITVAKGAILEYLPEHNVPFAASKTYQETTFRLDREATLIASDLVTAGRVSRGEVFDYDLYSSKTKLYVDGKLELYDHSYMEPETMDLCKIGLMEGALSNGSIYVYAKELSQELPEKLNALDHPQGIRFRAGCITEDLMIVRFTGDSMIELQGTLLTVWGKIRESLLKKKAVRIRKY